MSVPRWMVVPSGSVSVGEVGCTIGTSVFWPKIVAAIAPSGGVGPSATFSCRLISSVLSSALTSSADVPAASPQTTRCVATYPVIRASGSTLVCTRTVSGTRGRNRSSVRIVQSPRSVCAIPNRTRNALASLSELSTTISSTASTSGCGAGASAIWSMNPTGISLRRPDRDRDAAAGLLRQLVRMLCPVRVADAPEELAVAEVAVREQVEAVAADDEVPRDVVAARRQDPQQLVRDLAARVVDVDRLGHLRVAAVAGEQASSSQNDSDASISRPPEMTFVFESTSLAIRFTTPSVSNGAPARLSSASVSACSPRSTLARIGFSFSS